MNSWKRRAFWILSRSGLAVYSRFPVFGPLRVSVGIARKDGGFLVIERADGRGLSFPGGIAMPREGTEQAMAREFAEETGMRVTRSQLKFSYFSDSEVPVNLHVFEVEAEGSLRDSWEGTPRWVPRAGLQERLLPSQRRILDSYPEH